MKSILFSLLLLPIFLMSFFQAFAAGEVDHFEVILSKESAKVGEALDLTISAVDSNGSIVSDYTGDILVFSESDPDAVFPNDLSQNSYKFTAANEGTVKFENAVQFNNPGTQDLYVYDLSDEKVLGVAEVAISEDEVSGNMDIEILSPENGVTLGKNTITISGKTQKNHQVRINHNSSQEYFTTSNAEGIFEKDVENLSEGTNSFQAFILDADNNVIGESKKIEIKINSGNPEFKSIKIDPTGEVEALQEISIEVVSNMGLTSVTVIINDVMTQLTEGKDGIYSGTTKAPKDAGEYPIDVILKDEFAHQTMERGVETLIVSGTPELNAGGEIETIDTPANTTELNLTIKNIKVTELKTKSVMTWDALPDAVSYNVYKKISDTQVQLVQNVTEPRFEVEITGDEVKYEEFAIKAVGKNASGSTIQGDLSEMTKVQTGPEVIILALLALLLGGGFMYFQKRKAA